MTRDLPLDLKLGERVKLVCWRVRHLHDLLLTPALRDRQRLLRAAIDRPLTLRCLANMALSKMAGLAGAGTAFMCSVALAPWAGGVGEYELTSRSWVPRGDGEWLRLASGCRDLPHMALTTLTLETGSPGKNDTSKSYDKALVSTSR